MLPSLKDIVATNASIEQYFNLAAVVSVSIFLTWVAAERLMRPSRHLSFSRTANAFVSAANGYAPPSYNASSAPKFAIASGRQAHVRRASNVAMAPYRPCRNAPRLGGAVRRCPQSLTAVRRRSLTRRNAGDDAGGERTLVLVRHGESEWNRAGLFTGWHDPDLSDRGRVEAKDAGRALRDAGFTFDVAYTSVLQRAIKTLWLVLDEMELCWIPVFNNWRLNERMYGGLTGLDKKQSVIDFGEDQVKIWRRSFDIPPPPVDKSSEYWPGNDPRYANVDPDELPLSECLKDTIERALPFWDEYVAPDLADGKRVLVAAHGNTIRAICKHLDGISDEDITGLEIPTGIPLVYKLDANLQPVVPEKSSGMLSATFIGDEEAIAAAQAAVANQISTK